MINNLVARASAAPGVSDGEGSGRASRISAIGGGAPGDGDADNPAVTASALRRPSIKKLR
jgi:hypothetical protein